MAFNSIPQAWINSGAFVIQSLMQYIKDNFDALNSALFGLGSSDIPNGSFEIDSDSNGIPDNWTQNLYPGGSASLDTTTQAREAKCLKLTSPGGTGNGGGYYDSDYVPCNELVPFNLRFSHKSSVADIHNQVIIRWYTAAKVYISSSTVYNDATTNPTSWKHFFLRATPVSTARYFKVRLDGANSDDATAGSAWFDDVSTSDAVEMPVPFEIAEVTSISGTFEDVASFAVHIPATAQYLLATGEMKSAGGTATSRYRIGSVYSDEQTSVSVNYEPKEHTLDVSSVRGSNITVYVQLEQGTVTAYYKKAGVYIPCSYFK